MTKIGILLHVYHLGTTDWERMIWGDPAQDELGAGTKFAELLLGIPPEDEVLPIIYSGPSQKDGLSEGAYTKRFILNHIDELTSFPRLKRLLDSLPEGAYDDFVRRLQDMAVGPYIKNTAGEVDTAAVYFAEQQVDIVVQVAAATQAPRCLRNQLSARARGLVDKTQQWFVTASDIGYTGTTPDDVVIAEPIHRKDNPLYGFNPSWVKLSRQYPYLSLENKKLILVQLDKLMSEALANQPDSTGFAN